MQSTLAAAAFVDLLGFGDLVEVYDSAVGDLDAFRGPDRDGSLSTLETRYLAFHEILEEASVFMRPSLLGRLLSARTVQNPAGSLG